jgi:hypothetical protein
VVQLLEDVEEDLEDVVAEEAGEEDERDCLSLYKTLHDIWFEVRKAISCFD